MPDTDNRESVMLLTEKYRILGEMRLGPDGAIWAFKHSATEDFVTVYTAQCFRLRDGKRLFDAGTMELNRHAIVALFRQKDLAFARKENT